jgi:hypothetical protein
VSGSNKHFFGVRCGFKLSSALVEQIDAIATKHGGGFTCVQLPDGWRFWFEVPNLGHPFDNTNATRVLEAVRAAGIKLPGNVL